MKKETIFKTMIKLALNESIDKHIYECKSTQSVSIEFEVYKDFVSVTFDLFTAYIHISNDYEELWLTGDPIFFDGVREITEEEFYNGYDKLMPEGETHRVS